MITAMPRIAIATYDFDGIVGTFRDALGMPVVDISESTVESLGARLAMCVPAGGSNIELMSPAVPDAPLAQSLSRFLDRRGEGPFALMLEAPDPDAEAELLIERGLNVLPLMAGAGGRDVHPRSTHGVLIRVYPDHSFQAHPDLVQHSESKALGLSGIRRVMLAVNDLEHAMDVYGRGFALEVETPVSDADRGLVTALCRPPNGGVIELVSATDVRQPVAASVTRHLEERGEGIYALVLQAPDVEDLLVKLKETLNSQDVTVTSSSAHNVVLESLFGARVLIEPAD